MTAASPDAAKSHARPAWLTALLPAVLVAIVVGLFASAFIWPLHASDPKDIPLGIAGDQAKLEQIEQQLDANKPDLFAVTDYADRDAVVGAIERRDVEGGLVVGDTGVEVLTASAGNAQVTQILTQLAAGMKEQQAAAAQQAVATAVANAQAQGVPAEQILQLQQQAQQAAAAVTVTTTDVVSGGAVAAAGNLVMLPALIGGMATAMLAFFMVRRPIYRIITLIAGAALAGLSGAAVLGPWFDVLPGSYGMHALGLGMGILAIGATIAGLATLLGKAGIGIGVALMMLVGNPWGGMLVPNEFLPGFMGWLGAHMPNGQVITVMKNISYFPEASQSSQWWILASWAAAGIVLVIAGAALQAARAKRAAAVAR